MGLELYKAVRDRIGSGSLLLFTGGDGRVGRVIEAIACSRWHHVGIVIVLNGHVYILESTGGNKFKGKKWGVQLRLLSERLESLEGGEQCWVRLPDREVTAEEQTIMALWWNQMAGTPYQHDLRVLLETAKPGIDRGRYNHNRDKAVFCSEAVTLLFIVLGWLVEDVIPETVTPGDFSSEGIGVLPLKGIGFGPEVRIG